LALLRALCRLGTCRLVAGFSLPPLPTLQLVPQLPHLAVLGIGFQDGLARLDRRRLISEIAIHERQLPAGCEIVRCGLDDLLQFSASQIEVPRGPVDLTQEVPGADRFRELL